MTCRESYMMLETQQDILDEVERDIKIAIFMGNNPDRIEMIRSTAEKVINEKFDFPETIHKLDNGEWVLASEVQQALGLTFEECIKRFDFSRTAEWWSVVGETKEERSRDGQKVVCKFRKKATKETFYKD